MYTIPDYVAAEIRATIPFQDDTLPSLQDVNRWIEQASKEIDIISNAMWGSIVVENEYLDYTNVSNILQLPVANIISIDKIEYNINSWGLSPSFITLTEGIDKDYISYVPQNEIQFVKGLNNTWNSFFQSGPKRFRVSYTYGSQTIPPEIEHLCTLMVARRVIRTLISSQANTNQGNISVGPIRVADPSSFSISSFKTMNDEINKLRSDIGMDFKIYKFTRVYDSNIPGYMNGGFYNGYGGY
jgi:hypothetical protein